MHGYNISDSFKKQSNFSYFLYENPFIKFIKPKIIIPTYQNINLTPIHSPVISDLSPGARQWSPTGLSSPTIKFGSYVEFGSGLSPVASSYVPVTVINYNKPVINYNKPVINYNKPVTIFKNTNQPFFTTGDDILLE